MYRSPHSIAKKAKAYEACLIGGAIGDALGAPIEFDTLRMILERFGPNGVTDLHKAFGKLGAVTDDTQMTLFTGDGLIRAEIRQASKERPRVREMLHRAYLRWLATQGEVGVVTPDMDGWLHEESRLFARRAPGNTCLGALIHTRSLGERAVNGSKGCGSVMRVAPIGLLYSPDRAFVTAYESSFITHGHPTAAVASGAMALIINQLLHGYKMVDAIKYAIEFSIVYEMIEKAPPETSDALKLALELGSDQRKGSPERVELLGAGWVAEEALAIAAYAALKADSFREGVLLAVNHSGDSDSTGSLAGQLLGLLFGLEAIPAAWRNSVELADTIRSLSKDLAATHLLPEGMGDMIRRYPPCCA